MNVSEFNKSGKDNASEQLAMCCGSTHWQELMLFAFPFKDARHLLSVAADLWYNKCTGEDWKEAFTHHPRIGDRESLEDKFASTRHLAGEEQSGVNDAGNDIIARLQQVNKEYVQKFGFIFIICATGRTAAQMLRSMVYRLKNSQEEELAVAMGEQHKITVLRLKKIISASAEPALNYSQITTHVLDTTAGKPGFNISIRLMKYFRNSWITFAQGITNSDGRIGDLLPQERILPAGKYKMVFDTGAYFQELNTVSFYPEVEIQFNIAGELHYHIPLLLNPFGYSTYRGS